MPNNDFCSAIVSDGGKKNLEICRVVFPMLVVAACFCESLQRCMQGVDQITQHILTTAASVCCFPASLAQRCVLSTCSSWHVCLKGGLKNRRLQNQSGLLFRRSWCPSPGTFSLNTQCLLL